MDDYGFLHALLALVGFCSCSISFLTLTFPLRFNDLVGAKTLAFIFASSHA